MAEANLLVTYDPAHGGKAREETESLLESVGETDIASMLQQRVDLLICEHKSV